MRIVRLVPLTPSTPFLVITRNRISRGVENLDQAPHVAGTLRGSAHFYVYDVAKRPTEDLARSLTVFCRFLLWDDQLQSSDKI